MNYAHHLGLLFGVIFCSSLSGVAAAQHAPGLWLLSSIAAGVFGGFLLPKVPRG